MITDYYQPPQRDRAGRLRFHSAGVRQGCPVDGNSGSSATCAKCREMSGDVVGNLLQRLDKIAGGAR